jgi:hypothetical protein
MGTAFILHTLLHLCALPAKNAIFMPSMPSPLSFLIVFLCHQQCMQGEILSVRESAAPCGRPSVNLLLTVLYVSSTLPLSAVDAQRAGYLACCLMCFSKKKKKKNVT